jgi:hypothetical protein
MLPLDPPIDDVKPLPRGKPVPWLLGLVLVGSWILIAVINPDDYGIVSVGYLIGTIFGQTTLAAGWTVFGAQWLPWRLAIAAGWITTLLIALGLNFQQHGGGPDFLPLFAICLVGQWMAAQAPLWILAFCLRVRLRHASHVGPSTSSTAPQFGMRQMMIFTTAMAALLGIGRLLAPLMMQWFGNQSDSLLLVFLAAAAVATSLPTLIAAFLPRHALVATIVALILVLPVTYAEWPLLGIIDRGGQSGPDMWDIIVYLNVFTVGWVAVVAWLMRAAGYRLAH